MAENSAKKVVEESKGEEVKVETVSKAEYDNLVREYNKVVNVLNKVLRENNELRMAKLFDEAEKEVQ